MICCVQSRVCYTSFKEFQSQSVMHALCSSIQDNSKTPTINLLVLHAAVCIGMRPSLGGKFCTHSPSVCQSVPRLRFYRNRKAIETRNLVKTCHWTRVTRGANMRSKVKRQRHWESKGKYRFFRAHIFIKSGSI